MVGNTENRHVTDEEAAEIGRLFVLGKSCIEIAARMGRDRSTISAVVKRRGFTRATGTHDIELAVIEHQLARLHARLLDVALDDAATEALERRLVRLSRERRLLLKDRRSETTEQASDADQTTADEWPDTEIYEDETVGIRMAVPRGWRALSDDAAQMDDGASEPDLPSGRLERKSRPMRPPVFALRMASGTKRAREHTLSATGPPGTAPRDWIVAPMVVHGRTRRRQDTGGGRMAAPDGAMRACWENRAGRAEPV